MKFNGLGLLADTLHHMPKHAIPGTWTALPAPLSTASVPTISDIAVLNRRDALIVYVPAVKGAADYRAYIYDAAKVTFNGTQPRGAVLACAGYRQRYRRSIDSLLANNFIGIQNRELLQAIEVPGLVADGNYKVIVEALASPCPFTGMPGHTSTQLSLGGGGGSFQIRGFNDVMAAYGNEIVNGQGSTLADFKNSKSDGTAPNEPIGKPVPPATDPVVIARSAITVVKPAADEALNGPVFDVGNNAMFDDFSTDAVMTAFQPGTRGEGAGLTSEGKFGSDWFFWMIGVQPALTSTGGTESGTNPKGVQVWQRHGRLYTTFGDNAQDIMGSVYFSSTKTVPQQLDGSKYVHSMFRVNSGATGRRYWHWLMCGGATRDELVDPTTHIPRIRPVASPHFNQPGGANPSGPMTGTESADPKFPIKECLNIVQDGDPWTRSKPGNTANTWFDEPHTELVAFINPANTVNGFYNLKPTGINDGDTNLSGGMPWRLNAQRQATQPMFEPFDQEAPLTHYDVFVRPDRVIFYINGRQAWCGDLSESPLKMKYGLISYGSLLYHSGAELGESYASATGGTTHYIMNTPWADTRAWDVVGHSDMIDIPTQFTFDAATCFKPGSWALR